MGLIVKPYSFSAGAIIVASEHNDNFDTCYNLINGSIDNNNIVAAAGIVDTKLATISTSQKVNLTALVATAQAQGDILFASSSTVLTRLPKSAVSTVYLANTGTSNGPQWGPVNLTNGVVGVLPAANGGAPASFSSVYTASDTFTAPTGVTKVYVTMVAGGGGGGGTTGGGTGGGGGGAGGMMLEIPFTTVAGNNYAVTVGAGGAGGAAGNNAGIAGTASAFDILVVPGGAGGAGGGSGTGGVGGAQSMTGSGTGAGFVYTISGGSGSNGNGAGGASLFGKGTAAPGLGANGNNGAANTGTGGSAGTASGGSTSGGTGASGIVIVKY